MFSETRYALNGDLRVAYRASPEGERDIVFVPAWSTSCEMLPELPSVQGWIEAMTSLGGFILFDQPGCGVSDPVTLGALPTLEQWADSITTVLDDVGSREAILVVSGGALSPAALFAATYPSRTSALIVLEGYATPMTDRADGLDSKQILAGLVTLWGTGDFQHVINPDMPWNEEIRATWARHERLSASPATASLMLSVVGGLNVRPLFSSVRVPTLVVQHSDDLHIPPMWGMDTAQAIPGAKYVELPGRNMYHFVEPNWRASFRAIAEFLTGHQAESAATTSAASPYTSAPA